ncbi:MAG: M67 family metallopeptidase [Deltaproteobacteria bacterium]|jgi:proteasome lid subunit RPN8/RPN11|nr:M67 family metallopeptidase [Deltaproteobacteria bacterium]
MGETIIIAPAALKLLETTARESAPLEACGLIAGARAPEGLIRVERVFPLPNLDRSGTHFSIDPMAQLRAVRAIRELGLNPLGNFHSHPETPSRPSAEDLKFMVDPQAVYLIISLTEDPPVINAFGIDPESGLVALIPAARP